MTQFRTLAILIILICVNAIAYSQNEVDSLRNALTHASGKQLIDIKSRLATFLTITNLEEAKDLATEAMSEAREMGYEEGLIESLVVMGSYHSHKSNIKKASDFLTEAIQRSEKLEYTEGLVRANFSMGANRLREGLYAMAVSHFDVVSEIAEEMSEFRLLSLMNIGIAKTELGELSAAEDYLQQSLKLAEEQKSAFRIAQINGNLGNLEFGRANYSLALNYHKKGYEIFRDNNAKLASAISLIQLGRVNTKLNQNKKALQYFDSASVIRKSMGDERGLISIMRYKAQTLHAMKRYEESRTLVKTALPEAEDHQNFIMLQDLYVLAVELSELQKDYQQALDYFRSLAEVRDSISTRANRAKFDQMVTQFDFDRLKNEADAQAQLNEISQLKLGQRNFAIAGLFVLLLLLLVIFLLNRSRLRNKLTLTNEQRVLLEADSQQKQEEIVRLTSYADGLLQKEQAQQDDTRNTDGLIGLLDVPHIQVKDWANYQMSFDKVFPGYFDALDKRGLTLNEQRLASLIKLRLANKEMATILGITPKSVTKAKSRLSTRLKLEGSGQLDTFLSEL